MSTETAPIEIRRGTQDDLAAIAAILNYYVQHTAVTFQISEHTVEERQDWFSMFTQDGPYQLFVAERQGDVVGFVSSRQFRAKAAYNSTVETTVYLRHGMGGKGLGSNLYHRLFEALRPHQLHRAVAGITLPNQASCRLHESLGFTKVGIFSEVGLKQGQYWDVLWLEKKL